MNVLRPISILISLSCPVARAANGDPKAMAMLGELYSGGLGVKRDFAKAADWYRRAADLGDREAMFALAMLRISGRGGPTNREEAAKLLASSAKLGSPKAAYNLALLYLDGQTLPQDQARRRTRSEEHTSELQSRFDLVCRLLLEKKKKKKKQIVNY